LETGENAWVIFNLPGGYREKEVYFYSLLNKETDNKSIKDLGGYFNIKTIER
jgi:hypothetical protein